MSLIPDHYICPRCGGYDLPASCFTLSNSCRCDEEAEHCPICGGPDYACCGHSLPIPYTRMSIDLDDDGGRVAA